jgi:hypothetical protein
MRYLSGFITMEVPFRCAGLARDHDYACTEEIGGGDLNPQRR